MSDMGSFETKFMPKFSLSTFHQQFYHFWIDRLNKFTNDGE